MLGKKEMLFQYMRTYTQNDIELRGRKRRFTTQELSQALNMQRSNLSTLLNQLVREGRVEKIPGRPVLYRVSHMPGETSREESCFNQLIGHDGSLKNMVQLAKAAIVYPDHSLPTLIVGPTGAGKSYFVTLMAQYARDNRVIGQDAPFVKFNCRYYSDVEELTERLFGIEQFSTSAVCRAQGGILFIDHADLLSPAARDLLFDLAENESREGGKLVLICATDDDIPQTILDAYASKFSIRIDIPQLQERRIDERFQLVQTFFCQEAVRMQRSIHVNAELLRCVLLYRCENNIKQLKNDIRLGCANAYVRSFHYQQDSLLVYLSDFPPEVRKGFLYYKENREKVERLIPQNYSYMFSAESMRREEMEIMLKTDGSENIYDVIDRKVEELRNSGIQEENIITILDSDLEAEFKMLHQQIRTQQMDKESILKVVDRRIVTAVEDFLHQASDRFGCVYSESAFYGLCLHLSASLEKSRSAKLIIDENMLDQVLRNHAEEFHFSVDFVKRLNDLFEVALPAEEAMFITMFLCNDVPSQQIQKTPVLLVAMHGKHTAESMVDVVQTLLHCDNIYSFDMPLEQDMKTAYSRLQGRMQEIDRGKGIIMLYDMGSLKTMAETIARDTGISLRTVMLPTALIALDASRKIAKTAALDDAYRDVLETLRVGYHQVDEAYERIKQKKVILTLCMSGQGGAVQIKKYLEKHLMRKDIDIVPLAMNDGKMLFAEINKLKKEHDILYIVGTYNPHAYEIPFIPISRVFETPSEKLDLLLATEHMSMPTTVDYETIYEYLSEQLPDFDIRRLKKTLPRAIAQIKRNVNGLSQDQELGIFLHVACATYRIQKGEHSPINPGKNDIILRYKRLYNGLQDILKPLEEAFEITLGDDELAYLIGLIKQTE